MTFEQTREQFLLAYNSNAYLNMCESDDMYNAISALEKQIPKKPIEDGYYDEPSVCPNCGGNVINQADNDYHFQYCHYCGQSLDWSYAE